MPHMVKVQTNRHGNLFFRIYWRGLDIREGIAAKDTPANRAAAEATARRMSDEIARGTFDYLRWFPQGNKAEFFRRESAAKEPKTFRAYYEQWIKKFRPPLARRSEYRDKQSHFANHILPVYGDRMLTDFGVGDIRSLLTELVGKPFVNPRTKQTGTVSVKTAKNILNGSLRAFLRDAQVEGLIERNPFDLLPRKFWPRHVRRPPDPFEEHERDEIIRYFAQKWGQTWRPGYVFLYTLFWTGARPSELTARRWRDLDLQTGALQIYNRRADGEEADTKTKGSTRTIRLFPPVLDLIRSIKPLRAGPDDYIFTDRQGKPIDQWYFAQEYFQPALTVLGIRHRDFYSTRHTFITAMLRHGENPKEIAEYVGNSPEVIWSSYAGLIGGRNKHFGAAAMVAAGLGEETQPAAKSGAKR